MQYLCNHAANFLTQKPGPTSLKGGVVMSKRAAIFYIVICLVFLSSFMLVSTFLGRGPTMLFSDESSRADTKFTSIINAIEQKDNERLKKLFSEKTQNEAQNLEKDIDDLFDFFKGEIISWEQISFYSSQHSEYGATLYRFHSRYQLTTTEEIYIFYINDCIKDSYEQSNIGLSAVCVCKEEYGKIVGYSTETGVYIYDP